MNEDKNILSENCELLLDTGCLKCDMFLPAYDALKMGCRASSVKFQATPIHSPPITVVQMMPPLLVCFRLENEAGEIHEKRAFLEVFVNESDLKEELEKISTASSVQLTAECQITPPRVSLSSSTTDSLNHVSPIKYHRGSSKGRTIIGHPGMRKLSINWSGETNHISLLDEEPWDI